MTTKRFHTDGTRLTDCCGAFSTYFDETLVCRQCKNEVPLGQGDGSEVRDGKVEGREPLRIVVRETPAPVVNKETTKALIGQASAHLAPFCANLGYEVIPGARSSYDPKAGEITIAIKVRAIGAKGSAAVKRESEAKFFTQYADMYPPMKKEDLGRVVNVRGVGFKIVGLRAGRRDLSVVVERTDDGREYTFKLAAMIGVLQSVNYLQQKGENHDAR